MNNIISCGITLTSAIDIYMLMRQLCKRYLLMTKQKTMLRIKIIEARVANSAILPASPKFTKALLKGISFYLIYKVYTIFKNRTVDKSLSLVYNHIC